MNAVDQFRAFAATRGLIIKQLNADGRLHRCDVEGKNGKADGAYILHLDGFPAGGVENHRDGKGWENWRADMQCPLRAEELAAHRRKMEAMQRERDAEAAKRHTAGRALARAILSAARPATDDHPYLVRKRVQAYPGAYVGYWPQRNKENCLFIPMYDGGEVWNVQAIFPEKDARLGRDKDFLFGARKRGLYFPIGDIGNTRTLLIGEGYATMASCHANYGLPALVAFDAGNIGHVQLPFVHQVIICADHDVSGTGQHAAEMAASKWAAQGRRVRVVMPPAAGTDFNDYFNSQVAA